MSKYGRTSNMGGGTGKSGRGQFGGGTFSIMRDEWVIMRILLPYIGMLFGMLFVLAGAALTRGFIWVDYRFIARDAEQLFVDTWVVTGVVIFSGLLLSWLAWTFWGQRKAVIVKEHATLTVAIAHVWWLLALWENYGQPWFSRFTIFSWLFGSAVIGLSWCLRNWAMSKADEDSVADHHGGFDEIGLGEGTHLRRKVIDGDILTAEMKMAPGKTTDDAKASRSKLAALAGKPLSQVHVRDHASGDFDKAEIVILRKNPFANPQGDLKWPGAYKPGESIAEGIQYATYEDSTRPELFISGKGGGSSQHFLVMGMSGCGKSKCWQCIYGTVLNRKHVNVIYIDPAKGIQTAGPLLKGIDLFADTLDKGKTVLDRITNAIRVRTDYLASKGLSHWEAECGINFLIVHIEEAARFARVKTLVELTEAARSAGIMLVFSLQRAEGSRLNTNTRYNLGGSMCFGTYGLRDAEFGLSEYTRQAGAIPHHWQDRFPGRHYLEAAGIDPRMFAMSLQTDWVDMSMLSDVVEAGAEFRTPMDEVTAEALGDIYTRYRHDVSVGDTQWQKLEKTGIFVPRDDDTLELPAVADPPMNKEYGISARKAEEVLWEYLTMKADNGIESMAFKDIVAEVEPLCLRKAAWINGKLKAWQRAGNLPTSEYGRYRMPVRK